MIKYIALALALTTSTAYAETVHQGTVIDVYPIYEYNNNPVSVEECREVSTPIYRQVNPRPGDALVGAIIGGAIGNQFGSGSGQDLATALGAIVGANSASRQNTIVGYTTDYVCETYTNNQPSRTVAYYEVTYEYRHHYYTVNAYEHFNVGETIWVRR